MIDDHDGITEMLDFLMCELSENDFVHSLNDWFEKHGTLTQKQYDALCSMYNNNGGM